MSSRESAPLRKVTPLQPIVPGRLYPWVKVVSWVELVIFAALVFFWLAPGYPSETSIFGLAHGLGYLALCGLIWAAVLRHEVPYWMLAATLTPVGPVGSVIAIEIFDRKRRRDLSTA